MKKCRYSYKSSLSDYNYIIDKNKFQLYKWGNNATFTRFLKII